MNCSNMFTQFIAIGIFLIAGGVPCAAATESEFAEQTRREWKTFLDKECKEGTSEAAIRKVMTGKYREVGMFRTRHKVPSLVFLIDDYHQLLFHLGPDNKLIEATIEPKGQWMRSPDGSVVSIPSQAEREMRTKAEQIAIRYTAARLKQSPETLMAIRCRRSITAATWDIAIIPNSLAIANYPRHFLEVTDDGQVRENPPFEDAP